MKSPGHCPSCLCRLPICPRASYTHSPMSIPTLTAMAVAAELHCDFLIPDSAQSAAADKGQSPMNCLFLCNSIISSNPACVNSGKRAPRCYWLPAPPYLSLCKLYYAYGGLDNSTKALFAIIIYRRAGACSRRYSRHLAPLSYPQGTGGRWVSQRETRRDCQRLPCAKGAGAKRLRDCPLSTNTPLALPILP